MTYFDYLETKFTEANLSMATGNPNDVTIWRQAKVNASLKVVGMSRTVLQWVYVGALLVGFVLIKLRLKKPPPFLSSIPNQVPTGTPPNLSVVPNDQAPANTSGTPQ